MSVAVPAVSGVGELLAEIASGAFVRERDGVTLEDDWDGIGQRLTATGTTCLDDVRVAAEEVILHRPKPPEGEPPDPSYVGVFLQLYLTAVIARVAAEAFDAAVASVRDGLPADPCQRSVAAGRSARPPLWLGASNSSCR